MGEYLERLALARIEAEERVAAKGETPVDLVDIEEDN